MCRPAGFGFIDSKNCRVLCQPSLSPWTLFHRDEVLPNSLRSSRHIGHKDIPKGLYCSKNTHVEEGARFTCELDKGLTGMVISPFKGGEFVTRAEVIVHFPRYFIGNVKRNMNDGRAQKCLGYAHEDGPMSDGPFESPLFKKGQAV